MTTMLWSGCWIDEKNVAQMDANSVPLQISSNINIIFCYELSATNCPGTISWIGTQCTYVVTNKNPEKTQTASSCLGGNKLIPSCLEKPFKAPHRVKRHLFELPSDNKKDVNEYHLLIYTDSREFKMGRMSNILPDTQHHNLRIFYDFRPICYMGYHLRPFIVWKLLFSPALHADCASE